MRHNYAACRYRHPAIKLKTIILKEKNVISVPIQNGFQQVINEVLGCVSSCRTLTPPLPPSPPSTVLWRSPAEDGEAAAAAEAAAEAGALLAVQRCGAHPAHVHVRPAGPLDGLRLVLHRPQRDRRLHVLGYR